MYSFDELSRPAEEEYGKSVRRAPYTIDTASEYGRVVHSPLFRKLQGKTQLFPTGESLLLRTRLTHSLEVAEIASRIVFQQNQLQAENAGGRYKIDSSIVAAAGLAHDIGHPPFGHTGEIALHNKMRGYGGFEGNAQTLRLVTKLENRFSRAELATATPLTIERKPFGLNFTYRTIAALLKYDEPISAYSDSILPKKGFYASEISIVDELRKRLTRGTLGRVKTIECQIMDLADDIAYSVYDLEDCMIASVATPADVISCSIDELTAISSKATKALKNLGFQETLSPKDVQVIFFDLFSELLNFDSVDEYNASSALDMAIYFTGTFRENLEVSKEKQFRRRWTEDFIFNAIQSTTVDWNDELPSMSIVDISTKYRLYIECLKAFNFEKVINSQMLRMNAYKCTGTINSIFDAIMDDLDGKLIHDDFRKQYMLFSDIDSSLLSRDEEKKDRTEVDQATINSFDFKIRKGTKFGELRKRMRFTCDYIASMTDEEALEMCGRLNSTDWKSVFGFQF